MATLEDLTLYFLIACSLTSAFILVIIIWLTYLHVKVRRLKLDKSNQLSRQTNMMADFCYTNPTIVKGEELDRRGFSMYSGSTHFAEDFDARNKNSPGGTYHEARSKF